MLLKSKGGFRWGNEGKVFATSDEAIADGVKIDNSLNVGMKDSSITFDMSLDDGTGFLTVDAVLARSGVQKYLNAELGEPGTGIVGVFRPPEEITTDKSIKTFTNLPVTDNHPNEMVTVDNIKKYGKGSISAVNVVQLDGETALATQLTITDKDLIQAVKQGKKELSVGYTNVLVQNDGSYKGEDYKYIQTDIIANHIAVVDAGRCGGICKMMIDNTSKTIKKGDGKMKVKIKGEEYDVPDAVANEIKQLKGKSADEGSEKEKENKEAMDKLHGINDSLIQENKTLKAAQVNINDGAINEKIELLTLANATEGVEVKVSDSTLDIKKAIVDGVGMSSKDKSEAYLDAAIDMHKVKVSDKDERKEKALESHKALDGAHKKTETIDVDAIGEKEMGEV